MDQLYTIGYEGATLEAFIATLRQAGITLLFDIRELPLSRRQGFSKTALQGAVESANIRYRHERRLGSPRWLRQQLHRDRDYPKFFQCFADYLATQADLVQTLAAQLPGTVALMCYERDPRLCHRRVVACALAELNGLHPHHLEVSITHGAPRPHPAKRLDSRQSLSATQPAL